MHISTDTHGPYALRTYRGAIGAHPLRQTRPAPGFLDDQRRFHRGTRPPARGRGAARPGRRHSIQRTDKDHEPVTPGREALGRSPGGLSTKIHLVADRRYRPIARLTPPGQHAGCPRLFPLMKSIRIPRRGLGRPRVRPARAMAGTACSSHANRPTCAGAASRRSPPSRRTSRPTDGNSFQGRTATRLRPRPLQGPQHRRTLREQAPPASSRRHPVRQARAYLPGHPRCRLDPDLAPRPSHMITGHALMRCGALRSVRIDGLRRIPAAALAEFVARLEQEQAA